MTKQASFLTLILLIFAAATIAVGQTTEFTFQGRLLDNSLPPTASYDFEFRLFDAEVSGNELGSDSQLGVAVNAGVFSVRLDFGTQFDGTPRFLQIGVRPAGSPVPFTILDPRQPISSTPYAIRSLNAAAAETAGNAAQLGGVDAAEYVQDDDPRMTNERQPASGSNLYIQNTTTEQTFADFSIGGVGRAGEFDTPSGYSIDGLKVLGITGQSSILVGWSSGLNNAGDGNTFVGAESGTGNTTAARNSYLGFRAGNVNQTGNDNAFVGNFAGFNNSASNNSFFGSQAGQTNTTGNANSFFGRSSGVLNSIGSRNSFFGSESGLNNVEGMRNTFIGANAGAGNTSGWSNVFVGDNAGLANTTASQNSFLGFSAGYNNLTGTNNAFVGQRAGLGNTTGNNNTFLGQLAGSQNTTGSNNMALGSGSGFSTGALTFATAIGPGTIVASNNTIQLGRITQEERVLIPGDLQVNGAIIGNLPSGSGSYIQNTTTTQSSSNFNISGTGTANIFNAATQYNMGSERVLSTPGSGNLFVGIGSGEVNGLGNDNSFFGLSAGEDNTTGSDNSFIGAFAGFTNSTGGDNVFLGFAAGGGNTTGSYNTAIGRSANVGSNNLTFATAIGAEAIVTASNRVQLGRNGQDTVSIGALAAATATSLCINGTVLAACSSSARYKENVRPFDTGFGIIRDLRPVRFDWIGRDEPDLGLIAEEVERVDPLLVTYNQNGEVQGVKYDRIGVVLINVVKEQQDQIDAQQKQIEKQEAQIRAMRTVLCKLMPGAKICSNQAAPNAQEDQQ